MKRINYLTGAMFNKNFQKKIEMGSWGKQKCHVTLQTLFSLERFIISTTNTIKLIIQPKIHPQIRRTNTPPTLAIPRATAPLSAEASFCQ